MSGPEQEYITPEMAAELANSGVPPDCYEARYTNLKTEFTDNYQGKYVKPERAQKKQYVHQYRPFEARTTNMDDFGYKGMPQTRKPIILGDNGLGGNDAPFLGETTQKQDFRHWQSSRPPAAVRPARSIAGDDDDRTFETENARSFTGAAYPPRQSRAPLQARAEILPFDGISTNQADYLKWKGAKPATLVDRANRYRPREDDRTFTTEAKAEYIKKPFNKNAKAVKEYDPCAPGSNLYMFAQ